MSQERRFRGGLDGHERPFDWRSLATRYGITERDARELYEQALRQASRYQEPRRYQEAIYLELLEEARQQAWRPSPGKVTRTMRLQAERAGDTHRRKRISPLTGKPIAPGKRPLTSYLAQPRAQHHETRVSEELTAWFKEIAPRTLSHDTAPESGASSADAALRLHEANLSLVLGRRDELDAHDRELLASEYGIAVDEPRPDEAEEDIAAQPLPEPTRTSMERAFGQRFDDVLVHPDSPEVTGDMHAFTGRRELWEQDVRIAARTERKNRDNRKRPQAPKAPAMVPEGSGQPMPESVRAPFEAAMGRSFADVRIHTTAAAGQAAAALEANAFTVESDIYFGAGQYAPGTPHGDRVLAHELVHVGQRQDGRMASGGGVSAPDDPLEREAYGAEREIVQIVQEHRSNAAASIGTERAEAGAQARTTTMFRGGPSAAGSGHSIEPTPSALAGSSPVHRANEEGEDQGTGPTVPEQSDE
ncbi:MAG TPA: DUF4157 domain-containing protein, partial [Haliangium sp.]|nr:DUF4157 domain-containing protein [Haliangium sp.]